MRKKVEPKEQWRKIKGYEKTYQISSLGQIRSLRRRGTPGRILRPATDKGGYLIVCLRQDGLAHTRKVHRIVLETFTGMCPESCETAHLNGVPSDNKISNLVWATSMENSRQQIAHGTVNRGEINGNSKLTVSKVLMIRKLLERGHLRIQEIARIYGVCWQTIRDIKSGRCWKHV